jgi:hypothetical protein
VPVKNYYGYTLSSTSLLQEKGRKLEATFYPHLVALLAQTEKLFAHILIPAHSLTGNDRNWVKDEEIAVWIESSKDWADSCRHGGDEIRGYYALPQEVLKEI